jgi:two-component system sensor histidine kinase KdpD
MWSSSELAAGEAPDGAEGAHPMATEDTQTEQYTLRTLRKRGQHKIFLGYAPGVGKTFTMLSEAHRRLARGEDIIVGFVETHGRGDIEKLAEGLPTVPRKTVEYRGKTFEELDTEAVRERHPEWVLVDELAHTNVPGVGHEKRWESVYDILKEGISVISTVNVQHFESLNDTVYDITGVRVRETLPDAVLDEADEVVLVDLTTDALLNRLKRGVVYDLDKIPGALANFFRRGNLVALRELALRKTAEEVDESLERYRAEQAIDRPWATEERVVVCVKPGEVAAKLVRRGYRLAKRLQGELWVLHVHTPGHSLHRSNELRHALDLARDLGAHVDEVDADSIAGAILEYAREKRATFILLGQSKRSRLDEVIRGSMVARLMRDADYVDLLIVADPSKAAEKGEDDASRHRGSG